MSSETPPTVPDALVTDAPAADDPEPWLRLHSRMIWVDLARTFLSLTPLALAMWVSGTDSNFVDNLWLFVGIAVFGVIGAGADFVRWVFTRYRITDDYVERRTGILTRKYRSVRRDRIRTVDIDAKLRHRLSGLRVVSVGAGQQASAGEAALSLDAIIEEDAENLRRLLLRDIVRGAPTDVAPEVDDNPDAEKVFATFNPRWVVFNMFNIWAYLMAIGLLWGGSWMGSMFGLDIAGWVAGIADWEALGWTRSAAIALVVVGTLGAIGLGINYFTEYWGFELARVSGEKGTVLRTRNGMFRTREVNRDDNRMRGIQISEPLLWRWMGMADTNVVTTGLEMWSMSQPTAILPRGPKRVAIPVSARVLATDPNPMEAELRPHPGAALRRRLVWGTMIAGVITALLAWLSSNGALPSGSFWYGMASWPVALLGGVISYHALGHAPAGDYVVVRSGTISRATTALQRSAVSTIVLRQSLFQQRLGLKTVGLATAAGWGGYYAIDLESDDALHFADDAAPGLLHPFLVTDPDRKPGDTGNPRQPQGY